MFMRGTFVQAARSIPFVSRPAHISPPSPVRRDTHAAVGRMTRGGRLRSLLAVSGRSQKLFAQLPLLREGNCRKIYGSGGTLQMEAAAGAPLHVLLDSEIKEGKRYR